MKLVVHVLPLFAASFTVIVIVVVPKPTIVPAAGFCVTVNEPGDVQLSVAETCAVTLGTGAWQLEPVVVVNAAGQDVITGGVASITVNVVAQVARLPAPSATMIVTDVVPGPTSVPAAGLCVTVSAPGGVQLSVAETCAVTSGIAD